MSLTLHQLASRLLDRVVQSLLACVQGAQNMATGALTHNLASIHTMYAPCVTVPCILCLYHIAY